VTKTRAIRFGLALSGGGAKGIAHVGVLKVLEEAQIPVHMLAGTSMGGVVAAAYAAGRSTEEIERFFRSLRLLDIVQRCPTGMGLLGRDKIADRLRDALGGDLTFDQLKMELALVAADLETGEEVIIRDGSVVEGVMATTALPIVFSPLRWRDHLLIDGGVLNPVPFDVVRHMGADRVIAVHTFHDLPDLQQTEPSATAKGREAGPPKGRGAEAFLRLLLYRSHWTPMVHISEHSFGIVERKLVEQRLQEAPPDVMIEVPLEGMGLFDLDRVDACLQAGQEAARRRVSELIELRDAPSPGRWARWWQSLRR